MSTRSCTDQSKKQNDQTVSVWSSRWPLGSQHYIPPHHWSASPYFLAHSLIQQTQKKKRPKNYINWEFRQFISLFSCFSLAKGYESDWSWRDDKSPPNPRLSSLDINTQEENINTTSIDKDLERSCFNTSMHS